jgi:hypothetical protein
LLSVSTLLFLSSFGGLLENKLKNRKMDTTNETLIGLLAVRELQIKELENYIIQLETNLNDLAKRYNELSALYYSKKKRETLAKERKMIGFNRNGG